jgi:molybdenum cofactor synthesis domain-containing protein
VKLISVREAEGTVLCHDITEIVPESFEGRPLKRGHVVGRDDIPRLLNLGKEHLYVWEMGARSLHENDAAIRIARAVSGPGITLTEPAEGKVQLKAAFAGLLKIEIGALAELNGIDQICVATLHSNRLVEPGCTVAGCRVVPLVIDAAKIARVEARCRAAPAIVEVKPFRGLRIGIITTGSEVYHGRSEDRLGPVLRAKVAVLGSEVSRQIFVPDDIDQILDAIRTLEVEGAEMILVTGGMSVDPDDVTPAAIRAAGGRVEVYGTPVLPGSMFMLAYIGSIPVLGLPGCVMYHKTTVFDLVLPRILAGEEVSRSDIARLGHGGICLECKPCRYPGCEFGKGS